MAIPRAKVIIISIKALHSCSQVSFLVELKLGAKLPVEVDGQVGDAQDGAVHIHQAVFNCLTILKQQQPPS